MTQIKICGITTPDIIEVAIATRVRFVGFVFYPDSPRHVEIEAARNLSRMLRAGMQTVGLFVDPTDGLLDSVLRRVDLDMIQLHGNETVARVAQIKNKYKTSIMKAFPVQSSDDVVQARDYEDAVDWFLFDAKPTDTDLPGGNGKSFDWSLLEDQDFSRPWMLGGGLTPENVTEALHILSPNAVDVSSGVESSRGVKDADKIRDFVKAVRRA